MRLRRPRFVYNDKLEPNIWLNDEQMNPTVNNALTLIAWRLLGYLQTMGMPIDNEDIVDIIIAGSTTNYYYDKFSDIDIALILNLGKLKGALPGLDWDEILRAQINKWRHGYNFSVVGRRLDIAIIDKDGEAYINGKHKSGPIYSLMRDTWIRRPFHFDNDLISELRAQAFQKFYQYEKMYKKIVHDEMGADFIETFIQRLRDDKNTSLTEHILHATTPQAMAYRMMRQCGYLYDLHLRAVKQRGTDFNLKP